MLKHRPAVPVLALVLAGGMWACGGESPGASADASPGTPSPAAAPAPPEVVVEAGGLRVSGPVVSEPVTGERSALFLRLANTGAGGDALLGIAADGVGMASLHRTGTTDAGVMSMRPVDSIALPPGARVELRPGGYHGMLEGLETAWAAGDTVRVRLRFRRAGEVEVPALVVPYAELDQRFPQQSGEDGGGGTP